MNIDIRKNIIDNFKDSSIENMNESIISGIDSKEEVILPGLGVFFELLWNGSDKDLKNTILNNIKDSLNRISNNN